MDHSLPMRADLQIGSKFPNFSLPDHGGTGVVEWD